MTEGNKPVAISVKENDINYLLNAFYGRDAIVSLPSSRQIISYLLLARERRIPPRLACRRCKKHDKLTKVSRTDPKIMFIPLVSINHALNILNIISRLFLLLRDEFRKVPTMGFFP